MNLDIVIIVLSVLSLAICIATLFLVCKRNKKQPEQKVSIDAESKDEIVAKIKSTLKEQSENQHRDSLHTSSLLSEQSRSLGESLAKQLRDHIDIVNKAMSDQNSIVNKNIQDIMDSERKSISETENRLESIAQRINGSLSEIRNDNNAQLDKMREVVDDKLNKSLDEKFKTTFSTIYEKLEIVQKGFNEMENLSKGVNNLNKVLNGVKTRGTWGETSLQSLIEDILAPSQYVRNANIIKGKTVEFCIKLPGNDDFVLLPVDSKFPLADYEKLVDSSLNGDSIGMSLSRKSLENQIKTQAKNISEYIVPPKTTDFAIMYLPIEGLYAEITKNVELVENMRKNQKVIVAGPSTFAALLNSLQVGFRSYAIQKNSMEIQKSLVSFRTEFDAFAKLLQTSQKKADDLSESLQNVIKRSDKITKKLKSIDINEINDVHPIGSGDEND